METGVILCVVHRFRSFDRGFVIDHGQFRSILEDSPPLRDCRGISADYSLRSAHTVRTDTSEKIAVSCPERSGVPPAQTNTAAAKYTRHMHNHHSRDTHRHMVPHHDFSAHMRSSMIPFDIPFAGDRCDTRMSPGRTGASAQCVVKHDDRARRKRFNRARSISTDRPNKLREHRPEHHTHSAFAHRPSAADEYAVWRMKQTGCDPGRSGDGVRRHYLLPRSRHS